MFRYNSLREAHAPYRLPLLRIELPAKMPAPDRLNIVPSTQLNENLAFQQSVRVPRTPPTPSLVTCALAVPP